jgi:lysophospholipase L1-like esterase
MSRESNEIVILCYGDSNTRGSIPCTLHERYSRSIRWPGRLQSILGTRYHVIEEGLGGRTTCFDDPQEEGRNGKASLLPCLRSHRPIDLAVLMLGTNDLKARFSASAQSIAQNAGELVRIIQTSQAGSESKNPQVLLVAPPPLSELSQFKDEFAGGEEKSKLFRDLYQKQAEELGCLFLDAGEYVISSKLDGIHWDESGHLRLAQAVAQILFKQKY